MIEPLHLGLNHTAPLIATFGGVIGFAAGVWIALRMVGSSDYKPDTTESEA